MFKLGLTGSIGMGKSATAAMFRAAGVPVHDADAVVHWLYRGRAAPLIEAAFPGTAANGVVDRARLSNVLLEDESRMRTLERIVHPLVREERDEFLAAHAHVPVVLLDIPLLFETGGEGDTDAVTLVTAPESVQRARVLGRPDMTQQKFQAILAKQMPDSEKRRRAHFLIETGFGFAHAERRVRAVLRAIAGRSGRTE
ncbi:MAG: dephospho-CoA kinase [Methylobacteriaceae bacterium]|jgi:dephospho-CoA kinase|nr:dephospho-CoA kinase [Methylobacteriaceae bacterium]